MAASSYWRVVQGAHRHACISHRDTHTMPLYTYLSHLAPQTFYRLASCHVSSCKPALQNTASLCTLVCPPHSCSPLHRNTTTHCDGCRTCCSTQSHLRRHDTPLCHGSSLQHAELCCTTPRQVGHLHALLQQWAPPTCNTTVHDGAMQLRKTTSIAPLHIFNYYYVANIMWYEPCIRCTLVCGSTLRAV